MDFKLSIMAIITAIIIGFMTGFLVALYVAGHRAEPTPEYKHWQLEQRGHYSYCPYCGEELKESDCEYEGRK